MDGRGNLYDSSCVMESGHAAGTSGVWMIEEICMAARVSWSQEMFARPCHVLDIRTRKRAREISMCTGNFAGTFHVSAT